ncbi:MAG: major capsid protein [Planctomycetaceae bacterium]|nr:major capsid protein [Planctomycetaceae bacterium]
MARSTNMVIPELYESESLRATAEIMDVFNSASGGCLVLDSEPAKRAQRGGDFTQNVRIKRPSGLDTRNDTTNPGNDAATVSVEQAKGKSVIQQRRLGPAKVTRDEVMSGFKTPADYTEALARMFAEERVVSIRNQVIAALVAAVDSADTTDGSTASADIHVLDVARGKTAGAKVAATMSYINQLLAKMGDARERIRLLVMPSEIFTDLVGDTISNYKLENVAGVTIYRDVVQAFGRSVMVMDVAALSSVQTSSYYTEHCILGLGQAAAKATIVSETGTVITDYTDKEVLYHTVRQDYDVEYRIHGMKWNSATANPTDVQLATAGNWDEDYEDHRDLLVVKGIFNATV